MPFQQSTRPVHVAIRTAATALTIDFHDRQLLAERRREVAGGSDHNRSGVIDKKGLTRFLVATGRRSRTDLFSVRIAIEAKEQQRGEHNCTHGGSHLPRGAVEKGVIGWKGDAAVQRRHPESCLPGCLGDSHCHLDQSQHEQRNV